MTSRAVYCSALLLLRAPSALILFPVSEPWLDHLDRLAMVWLASEEDRCIKKQLRASLISEM